MQLHLQREVGIIQSFHIEHREWSSPRERSTGPQHLRGDVGRLLAQRENKLLHVGIEEFKSGCYSISKVALFSFAEFHVPLFLLVHTANPNSRQKRCSGCEWRWSRWWLREEKHIPISGHKINNPFTVVITTLIYIHSFSRTPSASHSSLIFIIHSWHEFFFFHKSQAEEEEPLVLSRISIRLLHFLGQNI